jgi:hypothetical protein
MKPSERANEMVLQEKQYYSMEDFESVKKFDIHIGVVCPLRGKGKVRQQCELQFYVFG